MTPEEYQEAIRQVLGGQRLGAFVDRWFQGAPVDLLAAELAMPHDALWTVLAPAITARTRQAEGQPPRSLPPVVHPRALAERTRLTRAPERPAPPPPGVECAGNSCAYRCASVCGRTIAATNGRPRV